MELHYPYLLILPAIALAAHLAIRRERSAAPFPSLSMITGIPASMRQRIAVPLLSILSVAICILCGIAAARPQRIWFAEEGGARRNIMLALDVSGSMRAGDIVGGGKRLTRMVAVKDVVSEFVKAREGDRVGLVVFGSTGYLQAPLTRDLGVVSELVSGLQPGMAGEGTAIGDGLGLALKHIEKVEGKTKAIILLTDGVNNSGNVNPLQAATIASQLGVKVHTIGIGGGGSALRDLMAPQQEYDEVTLTEIAKITGGVFFNAQSLDGLRGVYESIDELEQTSLDDEEEAIADELFVHFVRAALICLLLYLVLNRTYLSRVPTQ